MPRSRIIQNNMNYNLFKLIEEGKLCEADKLIKIISTSGGLNKNETKGFVSLALKYYIITNDNSSLEDMYLKHKDNLMKRDILYYCNYLYNKDYEKSLDNFIFLILNHILISENLDYIIDNKLTKFLKILDGQYIKTNKKGKDIDLHLLKFYKFSSRIINETLNKISELIEDCNINETCKYLLALDGDKIVLDAGNILFSIRGQVTVEGYYYLINIIDFFEKKNFKPIVVIHNRHLKKASKSLPRCKKIEKCIDIINSMDQNLIIKTPSYKNDDYYILYISLYLSCKIITNDNFRDHIFSFGSIACDKKDNPLNFYIEDLIVKYNPLEGTISNNKLLKFSKCIQVVKNNIYIPSNIDYQFMVYKIS